MPALRQRNSPVVSLPWAADTQPDIDWRLEPLDWQQKALCREVDPDLFFPEDGGVGAAKKVCSLCPVKPQCLEWALGQSSDEDEYGILAGVGPRTRREMRQAVAA